jgi:hypothetical protein
MCYQWLKYVGVSGSPASMQAHESWILRLPGPAHNNFNVGSRAPRSGCGFLPAVDNVHEGVR